MIRSAFCGILVLTLLVCGLTAADDPVPDQPEPPVRLKKKERPPADPAPDRKPDAPADKPEPTKKAAPARQPDVTKDEVDPEAQDLEEKIRELMNRVSKNMGVSEKRLDKKDPGEQTQLVQRDITRDLDELIEQTRRQQQQQQQQQSNSSSSSKNRQARMNRMHKAQQSAQASGQQNNQTQDQRGNNARGGNGNREGMGKIADVYKDIWGHLPETLRQEMDQYSREQFMTKYNDLLKQYYATIDVVTGARLEEPPPDAYTIGHDFLIDFTPLLREHVLLEVPLKPLCRESCAGICPVCGIDQNVEPHRHPEAEPDARWSELRKLLAGFRAESSDEPR